MQHAILHYLIIYRKQLAIISLLIIAILSAALPTLTFDANPDRYFSNSNPHRPQLNRLQQAFPAKTGILVALDSQNTELFSARNIQLIQTLSKQLAALPYATHVESLSHTQYSYSQNDTLFIEDLIPEETELSTRKLNAIKQIALHDDSISKRLIDERGQIALIHVSLDLPEKNRVAHELAIDKQVQQQIHELEQQHPDIDLLLSGKIISNASINNKVYDDATRLIPLMYAIIFILLALFLRSIGSSLLTLLITAVACSSAMGAAAHLGIVTNTLSITAINIIITVAIADCVHIITLYQQQLQQGQQKQQALQQSLQINLQALLITSITTALGFLSMNFSSMPPAHDLGNITAIGVVLALLFSLTLLPALLLLLPTPHHPSQHPQKHVLQGYGRWLIQHTKPVFIISLILSLLLLGAAFTNTLNDRFDENLKKPHPFRLDNDKIDQTFGGLYTIEYLLPADVEASISSPEYLHALDQLSQWLRQQEGVRHVLTYSDLLKRLNRNLHGDDPKQYRLPETQQQAAQYLLLLEMSQNSSNNLSQLLTDDHTASRLIVTLAAQDSKHLIQTHQKFSRYIRKNLPLYMQDQGISLAVMWAYLSRPVLLSSIEGALFALLTISLLLILLFRSLRYGLLSLIPNLLPAAIGYGLWALFNGMIDLSQMMVFSISIGIVVDDTIHFLSKYLRARRQLGYDCEAAILYSFETVGPALWITTLVLVAGFGLLALSSFSPNANLGILTATILAVAVILDFLLLPSLLLLADNSPLKKPA